MKETALGAKLAEKGILPHNIKLQIAIADFQNSGGTYGVALAMLNAAYGRGSEGHYLGAKRQAIIADASPQNDDAAGHERPAAEAADLVSAASSPNRSAGRSGRTDEVNALLPNAAARRMPGHAKRGAAAIGAVQPVMQKSLFDSTVLPDGRRLREVKWSECPRLARRYRYLSRLLTAIHSVGVPADPNDTIDNLVNEDRLREIVSAVERFNDIH
ncbi:hypothetical protein GOC60_17250 [Sinorhizobium meliloti]|nr:hypothetical protein [Sinorhizobium meliloti]MDX0350209.1 hypothetical protein [Sinorhizobium meliloti]